jgi:hypothetical protein
MPKAHVLPKRLLRNLASWSSLAVLALAGCSSSSPSNGGQTNADAGGGNTVFTIVLENQDYADVVGSPNAPYINSLIATYGLATSYMDSGTHPSLPNYLYMVSGAPQYNGGLDLPPNSGNFPVDAQHLGTQLSAAGIPWRSYQEGMGTPCLLTPTGAYAPKHDPFLYFKDIQSDATLCASTNVDYSELAGDLAANKYRYLFITPSLVDDGHDPTTDPVLGLKQADAWLKSEVPKILDSAAYKAGGVLFITWDEAEGRGANSKEQVPMIVVSTRIKSPGFQSSAAYSHASYLRTVETIFGLAYLGAAATAKDMLEFLK